MDQFFALSNRRQWLTLLAATGLAPTLTSCATPSAIPAITDEDSAYQLAKEAFVYGFPLVYFARFRHLRLTKADAERQAPYRWNALGHVNGPVGPTNAGAPQTDTFYSRLFYDVKKEPLIIRVPATDGRYWSLEFCDFTGFNFDIVNRRNTAGPTLLALVGPQWKGSLPAGVSRVIRSPMNMGFTVQRTFYAGAGDRATAVAIQTAFDARPLSVFESGEAWDGIDGTRVYAPIAPATDTLADFKAMWQMWQESPPPVSEQDIWRRYAPLGLSVGGTPIDNLPDHVRKGMARAESEMRKLIVQTVLSMPGQRTANGWVLPKPRIGYYDDKDFLYRAAMTQGGTVALPVSENVYVIAQHEPDTQKRLNGSRRYELYFSKEMLPQAGAFWSVHGYTDRFTLIPNPSGRYSVGDRTPGLIFDDKGGLTVYVQSDSPGAGREANWLATVKEQSFTLVIRAYEPQGDIANLTWTGPQIRVNA